MKIINVGRFPPPIGGVSYFLQRLKPYIEDSGMDNIFFDISGIGTEKKRIKGIICCSQIKCFWKIMTMDKSLVVFHSNRLPILIASQILGIKHKIVIFTHGESILKKKEKRFSYKKLLDRIDYFVTPTKLIYTSLKDQYPYYKHKIKYIPFILFPKEVQAITDEYIIKVRKKTKYLLSGYAYDLSFNNGSDLYGVDMMIEVIYRLRNDGIDASFILLLPHCTNEHYYNEIQNKILSYNIEKYFHIFQEPIDEASSLYKISDIYVRPTNTDGDSFSVWESLYVKTVVIASDAAQRPSECIIFKNRDMGDFYRVTKETIQNLDFHKSSLSAIQIKGNEEKLIKFLKECCEEK